MNFIPADSFSTGHKVTADIFYLAESANRIFEILWFQFGPRVLEIDDFARVTREMELFLR